MATLLCFGCLALSDTLSHCVGSSTAGLLGRPLGTQKEEWRGLQPAVTLQQRARRMALARRAHIGAGHAHAVLLAACLLAALQALPQAAGQTTLTLQTAQPTGSTNTSLVLATALLTNAGSPVANQPIVFGTVGTTGACSTAASC